MLDGDTNKELQNISTPTPLTKEDIEGIRLRTSRKKKLIKSYKFTQECINEFRKIQKDIQDELDSMEPQP